MGHSAPIFTGLLQQWLHGPHPGKCVYTPQLNQSKVSAEGPPDSALAIDFTLLPTVCPHRMHPGPTPGHPDTSYPAASQDSSVCFCTCSFPRLPTLLRSLGGVLPAARGQVQDQAEFGDPWQAGGRIAHRSLLSSPVWSPTLGL